MITFKEYTAIPAVNNSILNMVASNPKWIEWRMQGVEMDDGDKVAFRVGSAIDCLLTEPHKFDAQFFVTNLNKPTGMMGKFIYYLPEGLVNPLSEDSTKSDFDEKPYKEAYEKSGYKTPLKTVVKNFWTEPIYVNYYLVSNSVKDKQVLSIEEYKEVEFAVKAISSNPHTASYFSSIRPDNIQHCYQYPIIWNKTLTSQKSDLFGDYTDTEEVMCKGLLDLVIWDHELKTVRPVDLKSTGHSTLDFEKYFYEYSYFRQCAFYVDGLKEELKKLNRTDYTILPFHFVVTPKKNMGYPALIFEVSLDTLEKGYLGGVHDGKYYKGLNQLISDYIWHKKTGNWSAPRDIIEKNYLLKL